MAGVLEEIITCNTLKQIVLLLYCVGALGQEIYYDVAYNLSVLFVYFNICVNLFIYIFLLKLVGRYRSSSRLQPQTT